MTLPLSILFLLVLIAIPNAHADGRRDNTLDAGRTTDNGAQQQQQLGNMERLQAAKAAKEAQQQEQICAS